MSDVIKPILAQISEVQLLAVPLESDYKHTLHFDNKDEQANYFNKKVMYSKLDFSYVKHNGVISFGKCIDDLRCCNYLMFRNPTYSDRWFYAFITDMEYKHDECTWIHFEIDVIQTWYFDYVVQPSFIEREHVKDDSVGKHTYPEGLETGEFISNGHTYDRSLENMMLVIGVSAEPDGTKVGGQNYNGIYSAVKYKCTNSPASMTNYINSFDNEGRGTAIQCIFTAPEFIVNEKFESSATLTDIPYSGNARIHTITHEKNTTLDGYTPKNNKLLCYPYNYLVLSNNNGASAVYRYEDFSNDNIEFNVYSALTPGCSIRAVPLMYKGVSEMDDEGLNLGKYPICNWQTDVYTNWLTQNSVNNAVAMSTAVAQTTVGIVGNLAGLNVGGAVNSAISGASAIGSLLGQKYAMSLQPPQVNGNLNCGDVITSSSKNAFHFYDMSIKKEYAMIIDEYFNMYGYQINRVKIPNKNHRENYWYTKTIDVNIDGGSIPMDHMLKIKSCYNNGITFWREKVLIGNYNLTNKIVD